MRFCNSDANENGFNRGIKVLWGHNGPDQRMYVKTLFLVEIIETRISVSICCAVIRCLLKVHTALLKWQVFLM